MTLLEAYLDESERPDGSFCVAGYAFTSEQLKRFNREWSDLTGGRVFHTKDVIGRRKAFKYLVDNEESNRLIREAVGVIDRHITFGVAWSCDINEFRACAPAWCRGFREAYTILCYWVTIAFGKLARESGIGDGRIAYFFESGHKFEAEARDLMKFLSMRPDYKRASGHYADSFIPKGEASALEAADLLAWEWTKFLGETVRQKKRRMRKSLRALVSDGGGPQQDPRYKLLHVTGERLNKGMEQISAELLALFESQ